LVDTYKSEKINIIKHIGKEYAVEKNYHEYKIGSKLKMLREKNGLSQKTVSDFLGMDLLFIQKLENDEERISTVLLERFCELYGCSSIDLLDQDNPMTIEYTQPLSEYIDNLPAIAAVNRIALNLLEMQRLKIMGDQFTSNLK
jgi:transcriptional regulator with XRE-family HTH domain